ncbi:hypothetical protein CAEBREN_16775 [Caenorhabditis brenneri]|uniref:Uncharacterized protein n=1 Tax=Caenorhabditis brenneri TaxID=135651 RepID=G0MG65_CAEBE|nr:hypothetical protein CAEBREN_16775 [Caenorhabditis brenneri]
MADQWGGEPEQIEYVELSPPTPPPVAPQAIMEEEEYEEEEEEEEEEEQEEMWTEELRPADDHCGNRPLYSIMHIPRTKVTKREYMFQHDDFLEKYARIVVDAAETRTLEYSSDPNRFEIYVRFCQRTTTIRKCPRSSFALVTSAELFHSILLVGMNYVQCASVLLDHFLQLCEDTVEEFCPASVDCAPGFPLRHVKADIIRIDVSNPLFEQLYLPRWMRYIDVNVIKCLNIGNAYTQEDADRYLRIYNTHFQGMFDTWQGGEHVDVRLLNHLRRSFPFSIVNQSNIPIQHVFRWIKGWMANLDGYRHIEHITYRHPSFHVNERVLRHFDHIHDGRPAGERKMALRNTEGRLAFIYLSPNGAFNFHVCNLKGEPNINLGFNVNEVVDDEDRYNLYLEQDWAEHRTNHDYANYTGFHHNTLH